MALDYAKRRWPYANRVTMPQLMKLLNEYRTLLPEQLILNSLTDAGKEG